MTHDDFLKFGKEKLPAEIFYDATLKIQQLRLDAELIIAGFIDGSVEIYHTDSNGVARAASDFAVIGEGEYVAASALLRREQSDLSPLLTTLYNVYEAKKLSESVGSVGQRTHLSVLSNDGTSKITSVGLDSQLSEWFNEYGPKPFPTTLKFDNEYYFVMKDK
jgi:hypothetical protein